MTQASGGPRVRFVVPAGASETVAAVAERVRQLGHKVSAQTASDAHAPDDDPLWLLDVAALTAQSAPPPLDDHDGSGSRCLVLVGLPPAGWRAPAGQGDDLAFLRGDAADAEIDALVTSLIARREARARAARLQRECDDLQLALEDARAEVATLGDQLSHELQAALTHMERSAAALEGLAGQPLAAPEIEHLRRIRDAARRAHGLVRDLATLGRVRVGRAQASEVDLGALVRQLATELTPAGRALAWRIGPLPTVVGDPGLLTLALRHLMGNAVKFTRPIAQAWVEVTAMPEAQGCAIQVRDNGVGFDPAAAARLFQPLQRLHPGHAFEGHGLGLAMVKAVADRHEGTVTARTPPEGGALFTLHLPGRARVEPPPPAAPPDQAPAPRVTTPTHPAPAPAGPALRILVVDDDAWVLDTLRALLERDGHAVDTLAGGEAALARLAEPGRAYDVVVTDWSMPAVEGPQVALAARQAMPGVHTIVLTGRRPDAPGSLPPGVDQVLGKPVRAAELRRALGRIGHAAPDASPAHL